MPTGSRWSIWTRKARSPGGELHGAANRIANFLDARGIGRGDHVAVLSEERLEKLILWMGTGGRARSSARSMSR